MIHVKSVEGMKVKAIGVSIVIIAKATSKARHEQAILGRIF